MPALAALLPAIVLVDLILLVVAGRWLGVGPILLVVVGTGLLGLVLARWQGAYTLARAQAELRAGRLPGAALLDGLALFLAAILLVAPGPITDLMGLLLLIPPVRRGLRRLVLARITVVAALRRRPRAPSAPGPTVAGPPAPDHSAARAAGLDPRNEVPGGSR